MSIFEDHGVTGSVISQRRKNAIEMSRLFLKIYKISEVIIFFLSRNMFRCLARHLSPANIFSKKKREKFRLIY